VAESGTSSLVSSSTALSPPSLIVAVLGMSEEDKRHDENVVQV